MSDFPPEEMVNREDTAFFSQTSEDNTLRSEMDGGYEMSRPRTTRRERRVFTTGFTAISQSDKVLLENFEISVRGTAGSFTWTNFTTGEEVEVRFQEKINFKYEGRGGHHIWDVTNIKLKEV